MYRQTHNCLASSLGSDSSRFSKFFRILFRPDLGLPLSPGEEIVAFSLKRKYVEFSLSCSTNCKISYPYYQKERLYRNLTCLNKCLHFFNRSFSSIRTSKKIQSSLYDSWLYTKCCFEQLCCDGREITWNDMRKSL